MLLDSGGLYCPAAIAETGRFDSRHLETVGLKALEPKPVGGRKRESMTLAEEAALLACFAKAAGAGEMLNIHDLKAAYEKAIGHRTSNSTVYSLLARHGWRKLMPRPFHPDRDVEAQNVFKKRVFLMLSGKLGGPLRVAVVVYESCSPTKRGSAGSTVLDHAGRQRG